MPPFSMPEQPQRTELSEFQKGQIVALSDLYSHREIGRQLALPKWRRTPYIAAILLQARLVQYGGQRVFVMLNLQQTL